VREKFSTKIAIHEADSGMVERGDMFWNRNRPKGHSKGSIGLLTADGDLFCGDLLANVGQPDLWSIIDDREAAHASVEKLKGIAINTVYPGHGQPFPMQEFLKPTKSSASTNTA
jgi:hydroxyacylglutathione hydrolase